MSEISAEVLSALRSADACAKCHALFSKPPLPGCNQVPKSFLKAVSWAYLCTACAGIFLGVAGLGPEGVEALREPLACQKCFDELVKAFKRDRETAERKVNHPKAVSYVPWCNECVRIVLEHVAKPKETVHA